MEKILKQSGLVEAASAQPELDGQHAAATRDRGMPEATRSGIDQSWACRDLEALKEMRAARDAEAATTDRTARLYDGVLRWALGVEAEAVRAGVTLQDYLSRGSGADHALWLAVATHRDRYPASAGPAAVREPVASARSPSLRSWAPVREISIRLGSAAGTLAQLADLTDERGLEDGASLGGVG